MKISISITSAHKVRDVRQGAANMVARTAVAAESNLDSLFVGDHHVTAIPYYQNSPILGRMLAEWGDKPAGALYLLPLWNPVLVAEQVATLASIAQGPFILQCGLGGERAQSLGMGIRFHERGRALEEALEIIKALLGGELVNHDGYYKIENAQINPQPPAPVAVWIGASARVAIERVARLGDVWLASPDLTLERARTKIALYQELAAKYGNVLGTIAIRQDIHIAATQVQAESEMAPYLEAGYRGFDPKALAVGDVVTVAAHFSGLFELGFTEIVVRNISQNQEQALGTIRALSEVKALLS